MPPTVSQSLAKLMCSIPLTLAEDVTYVTVRNKTFFRYDMAAPCTVYTNETFDPSTSFRATVVFPDLNTFSCGSYPQGGIGILPADQAATCKHNRIGSNNFPDSLVCTFKEDMVWIRHSEGMHGPYTGWRSGPNVVMQLRVEKNVMSFYINDKQVECPELAKFSIKGPQRFGVIMLTEGQSGALMETEGEAGIEAALERGTKTAIPEPPVAPEKPRSSKLASAFPDEEDTEGIKTFSALAKEMKWK